MLIPDLICASGLRLPLKHIRLHLTKRPSQFLVPYDQNLWYFLEARSVGKNLPELCLFSVNKNHEVKQIKEPAIILDRVTLQERLYNFWRRETEKVCSEIDVQLLKYQDHFITTMLYHGGTEIFMFSDVPDGAQFAELRNWPQVYTKSSKTTCFVGVKDERKETEVADDTVCVSVEAAPQRNGPGNETKSTAKYGATHSLNGDTLFLSPLAAIKHAVGNRIYGSDSFRSRCVDILMGLNDSGPIDFFGEMASLAAEYNLILHHYFETISTELGYEVEIAKYYTRTKE